VCVKSSGLQTLGCPRFGVNSVAATVRTEFYNVHPVFSDMHMTQPRAAAQDRDQQILSRLAKIEHKVDAIEQTNAFALRAEADKHNAEVVKIFGKSLRRAQVYLASDGFKSVQDIADHLGMKRQNVGTDLKALGREGLLELIDSQGHKDIWAKKPLDRSLRITRLLTDRFHLQENGLKKRTTKKTARKKVARNKLR
jgi:hypothetical protein